MECFLYLYFKFWNMKNVLVLIMLGLLFGCNKKEEVTKKDIEVQKPFIISQEERKKLEKNDSIPPPPPIPGWLVYGTNTFIIDKESKIYYFQREKIGFICGTGWENDTVPHFIDLQPKDLIEIPNNCVADFVKLNYKKEFRNFTFISSELDTLKTKNYFALVKAIETELNNRDSYYIRRTTQEEDTVLSYKKKDAFYYSDSIKWDKSRIKFPEHLKFTKRPTEH